MNAAREIARTFAEFIALVLFLTPIIAWAGLLEIV